VAQHIGKARCLYSAWKGHFESHGKRYEVKKKKRVGVRGPEETTSHFCGGGVREEGSTSVTKGISTRKRQKPERKMELKTKKKKKIIKSESNVIRFKKGLGELRTLMIA